MGEGVSPHDGLVRLHRVAGEPRDHATGSRQLVGVESRVEAVHLAARPQEHHDLLERAVSGPLAEAVYRTLHLASARHNSGIGIRDRQTEVVMAMHGDANV